MKSKDIKQLLRVLEKRNKEAANAKKERDIEAAWLKLLPKLDATVTTMSSVSFFWFFFLVLKHFINHDHLTPFPHTGKTPTEQWA